MRQNEERILRELAEQGFRPLGQCRVSATGNFRQKLTSTFFIADFIAGNRQIQLGLQAGEISARVRDAGIFQARRRGRR